MTFKRHYVVAGFTLRLGPSGATRRLLSIVRELPAWLEPGERVTLLHGDSAPPAAEIPAAVRLELVDIPAWPTWRRALAEARTLRHVVDALGADVLDIGTLPLPRRLPCPVVLTIHDLRDLRDSNGDFRRHPRWLTRRVLRAAIERAQTIVTPSEFTAHELRAELGNLLPPVEVVPGGIDDALLTLTPTRPKGRPYFLHVGHLESRKNLLMLLSAYATFVGDKQAAPDSLPALVLVGKDAGMRRALMERAAWLDLVPHVHFEGVVPEDHLRALYAGATAVLMPSRYEGFGLPALEALAVGVPTVVADAGGLPEAVGQAGSLLPPDDAEAWAGAMTAWAAEPRRAGAIAARKQYASTRTWSQIARATLEVWRRASQS